ncbi:MAG: hypothetical protein CSYNP_01374 [Syntrophus sp. SKADARSKE-3]|nr:hypothetical protein [Syntrophus sp. SKADARSKE-3]
MDSNNGPRMLILVAGAKGAVASTLAVAVLRAQHDPQSILNSLTTVELFPYLGLPQDIDFAGWDKSPTNMSESIRNHGVIPESIWRCFEHQLDELPLMTPPDSNAPMEEQVEKLTDDILALKQRYPDCRPVMINLLPAANRLNNHIYNSLEDIYKAKNDKFLPDMTYLLAAIKCSIPFINFSSNEIEHPFVQDIAVNSGVPICGRDGKTGQTYFKVVLASALKARKLYVDGWYSLNILGNSDGKNLDDPVKAESKLRNKTELLDHILGYHVGERYGDTAHKVRIDYYPPRGDAKEAWDVIDFLGIFGLPMSLRVNLQGRDSILAAPMAIDLGRWMLALQGADRSGFIPELAFFFKKPVGKNIPYTFEEQLLELKNLQKICDRDYGKNKRRNNR